MKRKQIVSCSGNQIDFKDVFFVEWKRTCGKMEYIVELCFVPSEFVGDVGVGGGGKAVKYVLFKICFVWTGGISFVSPWGGEHNIYM